MTTAPSSPPDEPRSPLARLVELALVVPIEVSGRIVEAVPGAVDKVPAAAERIKREVVLARFLGKLVVDQGVREVRSRLTLHDAESASGTTTSTSGPAAAVERSETQVDETAAVEAAASETAASDEFDVAAPDVATLALADYDHLSSAQIVGKLGGLDADERRAIERYERAGRHRRTILGKLDQLGDDG
jgi:hypothetical protein